jgi:hypothetical protein
LGCNRRSWGIAYLNPFVASRSGLGLLVSVAG